MVEVVTASAVRERLVGFVADMTDRFVLARQREHALTYVRGLIEDGRRKSLQPTLFRLGESMPGRVDAAYQSVQQFLADSPWDPTVLLRSAAERVAPRLEVEAWVVDDTGFRKDGKHSPGVKRQYSGTLGKVGNCQIGVSVHAAGLAGTIPLGWRLYLPQEWCDDETRRRKAKIPTSVVFATKPALAAELVRVARSWDVPQAPLLADQAYGDDTVFRETLDGSGQSYVVSVSPQIGVYDPQTVFAVPERSSTRGRAPSVARADRPPQSVSAIADTLPADHYHQVACRTRPDGSVESSRFAFLRVRPAHAILRHRKTPRPEWLVIEWPEHQTTPSNYWLSNLSAATIPEQLARLARRRWTIELDYRQLKGELGLDHYEGRSWIGWHHHCALVTCAHAFLTEERLRPRPERQS